MEPGVILGRETEDAQSSVLVPLDVVRVGRANKVLDREFAALDPDLLGDVDAVEDNGPTVRR